MAAPQQPERPAFLLAIESQDAKLQREIAPGVYVYGSVRPMGRIRAYSTAGLSPFAGRGAPSEFMLVGHVHVGADGKVERKFDYRYDAKGNVSKISAVLTGMDADGKSTTRKPTARLDYSCWKK